MEFGIGFDTHVDKWDLARYGEELGYDRCWVPDSQMIWSNCYAVLALAAANTRRNKLGTGVAIAGTRIAPVTAHSIASINQIAPGRTFLGIGTGHTAMRVMGQNPMPLAEFRECLRVVRELLAGEAVAYTYRVAGTAKTTTVGAIREFAESHGYTVHGFGITSGSFKSAPRGWHRCTYLGQPARQPPTLP